MRVDCTQAERKERTRAARLQETNTNSSRRPVVFSPASKNLPVAGNILLCKPGPRLDSFSASWSISQKQDPSDVRGLDGQRDTQSDARRQPKRCRCPLTARTRRKKEKQKARPTHLSFLHLKKTQTEIHQRRCSPPRRSRSAAGSCLPSKRSRKKKKKTGGRIEVDERRTPGRRRQRERRRRVRRRRAGRPRWLQRSRRSLRVLPAPPPRKPRRRFCTTSITFDRPSIGTAGSRAC